MSKIFPSLEPQPAAKATHVRAHERSVAGDGRHEQAICRVAYIVHAMQPGGLERCVAHLCNSLDRNRFQPMIVCLDRSGDAARWIETDDVPIVELHKRPGNDWGVVKRLSQALRQHDVSLAQSHNWGTLVETTLACRSTKTKHVHALHGQEWSPDQASRTRYWLQKMVRQWAYRRVDEIVSVADTVTHYLERKWGVGADRVKYLPNGVRAPQTHDPLAVRRQREQLGIQDHEFVFGSTGRMAPVKDFGSAIIALAKLVDRKLPVHLILVGEGPEEDRLASLIAELGMTDRVHLVGHAVDVGHWLSCFDVFVNSSVSEAMSMSVLEAMSVGLPVVATDVGDTHKLIDGTQPCGLLVPPGDPGRMADSMESMLDDEQRRTEFSAVSRSRFLECYSVDAMIDRYQQLYLETCDAPLADKSQRRMEDSR